MTKDGKDNPIFKEEFVPSTVGGPTEWKTFNDIINWAENNGWTYSVRSEEEMNYLFVLKTHITEPFDVPRQVLVYSRKVL